MTTRQTPKTILLAPDSFKGSLSATDFCRIAEQAGQHLKESVDFISRPMSDGGEGFVEAIAYAGLAERHQRIVQDPLGRPVNATFGWQPETATAIVEMAQASGLPRLSNAERDPMTASSYGTGQLLAATIEMGAKKIILGLGGSATNDGGSGALRALGFRFLDAQGEELPLGGGALQNLHAIDCSPGLVISDLEAIEWVMACDVSNPLLGEQGATAIFGPQKGVNATQAPILEAGLSRLADVIQSFNGVDMATLPGAGAAGGMAGGFAGLLKAQTVSGFDLLSQLLGLETILRQHSVDLVLTGEGKIDAQTRFGKLPNQVAELAAQYSVPTVGICGKLEATTQDLPAFTELHSIHETVDSEMDEERLFQLTERHLEMTLKQRLPDWLNAQAWLKGF